MSIWEALNRERRGVRWSDISHAVDGRSSIWRVRTRCCCRVAEMPQISKKLRCEMDNFWSWIWQRVARINFAHTNVRIWSEGTIYSRYNYNKIFACFLIQIYNLFVDYAKVRIFFISSCTSFRKQSSQIISFMINH